MTPWQPGDPVGRGLVYLPTAELRRQYHTQDSEMRARNLARTLLSIPPQQARLWAYEIERKHGIEAMEHIRNIAREMKNANKTSE